MAIVPRPAPARRVRRVVPLTVVPLGGSDRDELPRGMLRSDRLRPFHSLATNPSVSTLTEDEISRHRGVRTTIQWLDDLARRLGRVVGGWSRGPHASRAALDRCRARPGPDPAAHREPDLASDLHHRYRRRTPRRGAGRRRRRTRTGVAGAGRG